MNTDGMKKGKCEYCGSEGPLPILSWDDARYVGACVECARKYVDDQYVGSVVRHELPEDYRWLLKRAKPEILGLYHGPTGFQTIYDDGKLPDEDWLEDLE